MLTIAYTVNADTSSRNLGKNPAAVAAADWQRHESDLEAFVTHNYVNGRTLSYSTFDLNAPLVGDEKSHRLLRLWRGSQLIVIDIDQTESATLDDIKNFDYVKLHAAAVYPSSRYSPKHLKAHLVFVLADVVTNADQYAAIWDYVAQQLPIEVDRVTRSPVQAVYGTFFTSTDMQGHVKSLDDGLCYYNPHPKLINHHAVLADLITRGAYQPQNVTVVDESQEQTDILNRRAILHAEAPPEKQLSVTLEALRYALKSWGHDDHYRDRLPLVFAAYAGSPDNAVRDMLYDHEGDAWTPSQQREQLHRDWLKFANKPTGVTVASLFYYARMNGWLQHSSVELNAPNKIHTQEVGDWLINADLPTRILLKSGTGTGKTRGAIQYIKTLNNPKVLCLAPSVKLCVALSAVLEREGVANTLYIDPTNSKTKDRHVLNEAQILVTTLQTFGVKLGASGVDLSSYDLVVMDESDEMISAFVRSGLSSSIGMGSHVTKEQARYGVEALAKIFADAKQVFMLDGTATDLSRFVMETLSVGHVTGTYENTFVRTKAPVKVYDNLKALRAEIIKSASEGRKLVIACDTKSEAALLDVLLVLTEAADPEEIIRITGDTVTDERVVNFFRDIEAGAKQYRIVIYNSAMGSGVSIEHTCPDIVYLIASYLPPRKLLQMLNRYRKQQDVRAFIVSSERLYSTTTDEKYERLKQAVGGEQTLSGLSLQSRETLSEFVTQAALIAATDEFDQTRAVRDFFIRLLRDEGRDVYFVRNSHVDALIAAYIKDANQLLKDRKEEILASWREVEPIKRGDTLPDGITADDMARGILHGLVHSEFGEVESGVNGLDDMQIAKLAIKYKPLRWLIDRWLRPDKIMTTTVEEMYNKRKELVTFRLYFSKVELVALLGTFLPSMTKGFTDNEIESAAYKFVREVERRKPIYDIVANSYNSFDKVEQRDGEDIVRQALTLANNVCQAVGLKLKRTNGGYRPDGTRERITKLVGLDELYMYLTLRGGYEDILDVGLDAFNKGMVQLVSEQSKRVSEQFKKLGEAEQNDIMSTLSMVEDITFTDAMKVNDGKRFG